MARKPSAKAKATAIDEGGITQISIPPAKLQTIRPVLVGMGPLVMNKFSNKAREQIMQTQMKGSQAKSRKVREPKDFDEVFQNAIHYADGHAGRDPWIGIPAAAFRAASISACRLIGFKMTIAKLSLFVEADGIDNDDAAPLVRLIAAPPEKHIGPVRNETGVVDIRARPLWREWAAVPDITYDADQFGPEDVINLLDRAGRQVGILEGRPDSRRSNGCGWGRFKVGNPEDIDYYLKLANMDRSDIGL